MIIILLSGNSTVASDSFQSIGFQQYALDQPLKKHASDIHGFPISLTKNRSGRDTLYTSKLTNRTQKVRNFIMEESAKMKKNEWAKIIINQIQKETPKYVIITEWRYIAEYDIIKKAFPNEKIITISLPKKETYIEDLQEFQFNYIIKEEISKRCIDIVTFLLHK